MTVVLLYMQEGWPLMMFFLRRCLSLVLDSQPSMSLMTCVFSSVSLISCMGAG